MVRSSLQNINSLPTFSNPNINLVPTWCRLVPSCTQSPMILPTPHHGKYASTPYYVGLKYAAPIVGCKKFPHRFGSDCLC